MSIRITACGGSIASILVSCTNIVHVHRHRCQAPGIRDCETSLSVSTLHYGRNVCLAPKRCAILRPLETRSSLSADLDTHLLIINVRFSYGNFQPAETLSSQNGQRRHARGSQLKMSVRVIRQTVIPKYHLHMRMPVWKSIASTNYGSLPQLGV